jgi:hypothetical protein
LTALLVKKLGRLTHSQADDLILSALAVFLTSAREHLKRLHSCGVAHVLRTSLLVSLTVAVKALVLLDSIVLVDVFVLELRLLSREET